MIHLSDEHGWAMAHIEVQNMSPGLVGSQSSFSQSRQNLVSSKPFLCTLRHIRTIINYMLTTTITAKAFTNECLVLQSNGTLNFVKERMNQFYFSIKNAGFMKFQTTFRNYRTINGSGGLNAVEEHVDGNLMCLNLLLLRRSEGIIEGGCVAAEGHDSFP
jgi:hypothetical protein